MSDCHSNDARGTGLGVMSRRQLRPVIKKLKGKSPLQAVEFKRLSKLF